MNTSKDFSSSFELLKAHKEVILPQFCSLLIPIILLVLFLHLSGISVAVQELADLSAQFQKEKAASPFASASKDKDAFKSFLEEKGYDWKRFLAIFTLKNLLLLAASLAIGLLATFYFTCMGYAMIALSIRNKKVSTGSVLSLTNHFLIRLFSFNIVSAFIALGPVILLIIILIVLFVIHVLLGVLGLLWAAFFFIIYLFILGVRLIFAVPSMFLDDTGPIGSVKHSFALTKGHFKQVMVLFFVVYGLSLLVNSFISSPLQSSIGGLSFDASALRSIIFLALIIFFCLIEAVVFTFENVFLFYSYIDLKALEESVP